MISKERILNCFDFKKIDRIGRFDQFWDESRGVLTKHFKLDGNISLEDYFDLDIVKLTANEEPLFKKAEIISENEREIISRNGWGMIERRMKNTNFPEEIEPYIKSTNDIDKLVFDSPKLDERYEDIESIMKKNKGRAVFGKIGGPFLRTEYLRGKINYLMDIASDPEFVSELAERVSDHLTEIGLETLRRAKLYDTGIWIFDDIAYNNGPMLSPKSFEKIYLPLYKKMVKKLKDAGAKYIMFHSDGNIEPLLDMLIEAGIDCIHPVEPRAGMSIPLLKKKYGNKLRYIGGMCNSDILVNGSKDTIIGKTKEIIEAAKDGGVVIGSHSIGPDIPPENYETYFNAVKKYGNF